MYVTHIKQKLSCILGHKTFKITMSANVLAISCNKHDGKGNRMFVCLFSHSEFFTNMETSSLPIKGCKFFTYARHSWQLSSEDSLACHTYCDTGYLLIMVISRDTHTYCRALSIRAVTTCFYVLGLSRLGLEHPTFRMRGQHSYPLFHGRG